MSPTCQRCDEPLDEFDCCEHGLPLCAGCAPSWCPTCRDDERDLMLSERAEWARKEGL